MQHCRRNAARGNFVYQTVNYRIYKHENNRHMMPQNIPLLSMPKLKES